jgi:methylmalonyl-CoA/ethylmalonyl-CoA epimerase
MALAKKIDHLAVVVKDLDAAVDTFTRNFGFPVIKREEVAALGIRNALLSIGDTPLELFTPTTSGDNPAAKFLAERGEGLYVLSLEVDDLQQAMQALAARGIKVGPATPTADGSRLAFVSPKATHGVLLQFIERRKA